MVAGFMAVALTTPPHELVDALEQPALSRLATLYPQLHTDASRAALISVLTRADQFAGYLADEEFREEMNALGSRHAAVGNDTFNRVRELAVGLHDELLTVFLDDPLLADLSRRYLLF